MSDNGGLPDNSSSSSSSMMYVYIAVGVVGVILVVGICALVAFRKDEHMTEE